MSNKMITQLDALCEVYGFGYTVYDKSLTLHRDEERVGFVGTNCVTDAVAWLRGT